MDEDETHSHPEYSDDAGSATNNTASGNNSPNDDHNEDSVDENNTPSSAGNSEIKSRTPRRVKVYLLRGEDWLDNGTGYCMGQVDSENKPYFIVRNELDSDDIILKLFLEGSIQYQRQQETLIVWTDLSGKDLALSFQENEGCADLCDFIIKVQQENLSPMILLYYVLSVVQETGSDAPREITELVTGPIAYPPKPTIESLEDALEIVSQGSNSQYTRSHIAKYVVEEKYMDGLYAVFAAAESDRNLHSLHQLSDIIKTLLVYNEQALLDELLALETTVFGFVGILEYDRDYPKFKACHRDYLGDNSRFKMVIPIPSPPQAAGSDMNIFRRDFVLSYLKNVVLARNLDDQTLNTISSMIYNNQLAIIGFLKDPQANDNFLARLFALYDLADPNTLTQRRDGLRMLHQYVMVAKGHQVGLRPEFYSALVKAGLFKMVKFAMRDSDSDVRVIGTELLVTIIEQDVSLVNSMEEHVDELEPPNVDHLDEASVKSLNPEKANSGTELPQKSNLGSSPETEMETSLSHNLQSDMSLTLVLGQLLLEDKNPGLKIQAYEAIKTLLCLASAESEFEKAGVASKRYFTAFYEQVAPVLFKEFIDLASEDPTRVAAAESKLHTDPNLYQHLCDLISFCCREHEPAICRPFFFANNVMKGILRILRTDLKITLKLGVMRCFKSIILLNDYPFCRHIIDNNLFLDYFAFFESVATENSLANSLCLDLLEIIIRRSIGNNYHQLATHIYDTHKLFLETQINYVSTGRDLMQTVENHAQQLNDPTATSVDGDPENYPETLSLPIRREEPNHNLFENIQKEMGVKRNGEETESDGEKSLQRKRVSLESDHSLDQSVIT